MDFISGSFLLFLTIGLVIYYSIPKKWQQYWLLLLSVLFYCAFSCKLLLVMLASVVISYVAARGIEHVKKTKNEAALLDSEINNQKQPHRLKMILTIAIIALTGILVCLKLAGSRFPLAARLGINRFAFLVPVGISFYTLQMIGYLVDLYQGKVSLIRNPFQYLLFITYFPQILQGPIPRAGELYVKLTEGHSFVYENFVGGFELMLWGYFQKMVIADRANIIVNRLFGEYQTYHGMYMIVAAILYSIQLYTDFNGCVCIAKGVSEMFGIMLGDNFKHPYFATGIQDFWRRWHISLSSWLKDYVYIPLGGNRKGKTRKYINIILTFVVSGIWHGMGLNFMVWGLLHGFYQVLGSILMPVRDFLVRVLKVDRQTFSHTLWKQICTFSMVALAWVFFRATSTMQAITMIKSMFTTFNPWILWDGSLYLLGLDAKNVWLLFFSIVCLWVVSMMQERFHIREKLLKQGIVFRYTLVLAMALMILVFGIYGPGYDAAAFIYGGF